MTFEDVQADDSGGHPCYCVVVMPDGRVNACGKHVPTRDQPFCDGCERRHPETHNGIRIRQRALSLLPRIPSQRRAPR